MLSVPPSPRAVAAEAAASSADAALLCFSSDSEADADAEAEDSVGTDSSVSAISSASSSPAASRPASGRSTPQTQGRHGHSRPASPVQDSVRGRATHTRMRAAQRAETPFDAAAAAHPPLPPPIWMRTPISPLSMPTRTAPSPLPHQLQQLHRTQPPTLQDAPDSRSHAWDAPSPASPAPHPHSHRRHSATLASPTHRSSAQPPSLQQQQQPQRQDDDLDAQIDAAQRELSQGDDGLRKALQRRPGSRSRQQQPTNPSLHMAKAMPVRATPRAASGMVEQASYAESPLPTPAAVLVSTVAHETPAQAWPTSHPSPSYMRPTTSSRRSASVDASHSQRRSGPALALTYSPASASASQASLPLSARRAFAGGVARDDSFTPRAARSSEDHPQSARRSSSTSSSLYEPTASWSLRQHQSGRPVTPAPAPSPTATHTPMSARGRAPIAAAGRPRRSASVSTLARGAQESDMSAAAHQQQQQQQLHPIRSAFGSSSCLGRSSDATPAPVSLGHRHRAGGIATPTPSSRQRERAASATRQVRSTLLQQHVEAVPPAVAQAPVPASFVPSQVDDGNDDARSPRKRMRVDAQAHLDPESAWPRLDLALLASALASSSSAAHPALSARTGSAAAVTPPTSVTADVSTIHTHVHRVAVPIVRPRARVRKQAGGASTAQRQAGVARPIGASSNRHPLTASAHSNGLVGAFSHLTLQGRSGSEQPEELESEAQEYIPPSTRPVPLIPFSHKSSPFSLHAHTMAAAAAAANPSPQHTQLFVPVLHGGFNPAPSSSRRSHTAPRSNGSSSSNSGVLTPADSGVRSASKGQSLSSESAVVVVTKSERVTREVMQHPPPVQVTPAHDREYSQQPQWFGAASFGATSVDNGYTATHFSLEQPLSATVLPARSIPVAAAASSSSALPRPDPSTAETPDVTAFLAPTREMLRSVFRFYAHEHGQTTESAASNSSPSSSALFLLNRTELFQLLVECDLLHVLPEAVEQLQRENGDDGAPHGSATPLLPQKPKCFQALWAHYSTVAPPLSPMGGGNAPPITAPPQRVIAFEGFCAFMTRVAFMLWPGVNAAAAAVAGGGTAASSRRSTPLRPGLSVPSTPAVVASVPPRSRSATDTASALIHLLEHYVLPNSALYNPRDAADAAAGAPEGGMTNGTAPPSHPSAAARFQCPPTLVLFCLFHLEQIVLVHAAFLSAPLPLAISLAMGRLLSAPAPGPSAPAAASEGIVDLFAAARGGLEWHYQRLWEAGELWIQWAGEQGAGAGGGAPIEPLFAHPDSQREEQEETHDGDASDEETFAPPAPPRPPAARPFDLEDFLSLASHKRRLDAGVRGPIGGGGGGSSSIAPSRLLYSHDLSLSLFVEVMLAAVEWRVHAEQGQGQKLQGASMGGAAGRKKKETQALCVSLLHSFFSVLGAAASQQH